MIRPEVEKHQEHRSNTIEPPTGEGPHQNTSHASGLWYVAIMRRTAGGTASRIATAGPAELARNSPQWLLIEEVSEQRVLELGMRVPPLGVVKGN